MAFTFLAAQGVSVGATQVEANRLQVRSRWCSCSVHMHVWPIYGQYSVYPTPRTHTATTMTGRRRHAGAGPTAQRAAAAALRCACVPLPGCGTRHERHGTDPRLLLPRQTLPAARSDTCVLLLACFRQHNLASLNVASFPAHHRAVRCRHWTSLRAGVQRCPGRVRHCVLEWTHGHV
jgi:hypothetical protein